MHLGGMDASGGVGLATAHALNIGNSQEELHECLRKGALTSPWRHNLQRGRDGAKGRSPSFIIV